MYACNFDNYYLGVEGKCNNIATDKLYEVNDSIILAVDSILMLFEGLFALRLFILFVVYLSLKVYKYHAAFQNEVCLL